MRNWLSLSALAVVLVAAVACTSPAPQSPTDPVWDALSPVPLTESDQPMTNPNMGIRGGYGGPVTLIHLPVAWRDMERVATDGPEKIKELGDVRFAEAAASGARVIVRPYLDTPGQPPAWPDDLAAGDYSSPEFHRRAEQLIAKMGEVWDKDPRVAWIESGLIGQWGEQHDPSPTEFQEQLLGAAYDRAFPTTPVLRRYSLNFQGRGWGLYWDSFGCTSDLDPGTLGLDPGTVVPFLGTYWESDLWRRGPVTGEIGWNYCQPVPGNTEDVLRDPRRLDRMVDLIRRYHATSVSGLRSALPNQEEFAAQYAELQRAFGYRFVVKGARVSDRLVPGGSLRADVEVTNVGSAPFYESWPVRVALLEHGTTNVVVSEDASCADVRTWQPGDAWDGDNNRYLQPAATHRVKKELVVPSDLADGSYDLAVAIVDPATGRPGVRFANKEYRAGGWTVLSTVSTAEGSRAQPADPSTFDVTGSDPLPPVGRNLPLAVPTQSGGSCQAY